jgi:hypothetical protein
MFDPILGGGLPQGKAISLYDRYCALQGIDPATQRAKDAEADRRHRAGCRAVVNGFEAASRPDADAIAVVHHLVLAQERDLHDLRRKLEATSKECAALRHEVAEQDQQVRHLVEDLPGGIRVVVDQALDDRGAERGRP